VAGMERKVRERRRRERAEEKRRRKEERKAERQREGAAAQKPTDPRPAPQGKRRSTVKTETPSQRCNHVNAQKTGQRPIIACRRTDHSGPHSLKSPVFFG
jgi:hypothetical protein